jgi:hypothetical protein
LLINSAHATATKIANPSVIITTPIFAVTLGDDAESENRPAMGDFDGEAGDSDVEEDGGGGVEGRPEGSGSGDSNVTGPLPLGFPLSTAGGSDGGLPSGAALAFGGLVSAPVAGDVDTTSSATGTASEAVAVPGSVGEGGAVDASVAEAGGSVLGLEVEFESGLRVGSTDVGKVSGRQNPYSG